MNDTNKPRINDMTDLKVAQARAIMTYESAVRAEERARIELQKTTDRVADCRTAMIQILCNGES
jgi:hypothetical protein